VVLKNYKGPNNMFKCPKCDYKSEVVGNCPTDNEVLVEELGTVEESDVTPSTTDEPVSEEDELKSTEE